MRADKYNGGNHMKEDTRIALLEQSIGHINETLLRIDQHFDRLEQKMDIQFTELRGEVKSEFAEVKNEIKEVRTLCWSQFRWIMGTLFVVLGSIVAAVIKGHGV